MGRNQDGRSPRMAQALIRLQLIEARKRADAISRELDGLGALLRHLDRISSSVEQLEGACLSKGIFFKLPAAGVGARGGSKTDQPL